MATLHGWPTWTCLLECFVCSSSTLALGHSDLKPLEACYYKHMFEREFAKASTSENVPDDHGLHSSSCLMRQECILISGALPGWVGPRLLLLRRLIRAVPVESSSPAELFPASSHRMSPYLLHVQYRIQGSPGAHHGSTLKGEAGREGKLNPSSAILPQ